MIDPRAGRRDAHLWFAAALTGVGLMLVAAEIAVYLSHPPIRYRHEMAVVELCQYVTQGASTLVVGFLLVTRRAARTIGWFLLVQAFIFSIAALISTSLRFATVDSGPVRVAAYAEYALWQVPRLTFAMFPLFFPTGRLPHGRWSRWLLAVLVTAVLAGEANHLLGQRWWHPGTTEFANALFLPGWPPVEAMVKPWLDLVMTVAAVLVALSPFARWRGLDRLRRRQIAIVMPVHALLLVEEVVRSQTNWSWWIAGAKLALGVLVPAVIGYAVVNTRLYELDRAARRIVAAVVPLLLLGAVYAAAAFVMSAVLPGGSGVAAVLAVLAALVGLVLRPTSQWVLRRVDRLLYGDRAEPYQLARRLAARIRDGTSGDEVPGAVCQVVVSALRLPGAALDATDGFRTRRLAAVGVLTPAASLEAVELRYHGRTAGRLLVMPRSGQAGLDDLDRAALQPLADLAAPVVSTALLQQELATSRARLVKVREEERDRLSRDVHDGVGPSLAAIRLQIDAAIALLPGETVSGSLLAGVSRELHDIVGEMRRITDDLRPPALERLGLAGALADLAERLSAPALPIRAELAATLPPVPPPVELAAYRIAAEAVANAIRHSSATTVVVSADADGDVLTVRVSDDGTGIVRRGPRAGLGLSSMAQRAHDVGGVCDVHTAGTGTTVTARLPVRHVEPTLAEL